MQSIPDSEAQSRLLSILDEVSETKEPITITRNGEGAAVLVAAGEFAAMEETLYLLSTGANAKRIRQGISDYRRGKLQAGELCD